jgi:hypothetical protein
LRGLISEADLPWALVERYAREVIGFTPNVVATMTALEFHPLRTSSLWSEGAE